nr:H174 [uncultured bacterium]
MPAYLIYRAHVHDAAAYRAYMVRTPDAIAAFGGRFLARGGQTVTLEGAPETARVIIVEFPSLAAAQAFYDSEVYRAAMPFRQGVADVQMVVVDGLRT